MTEIEKLRRGQVWILETLFQVAEEHDCMVDDFRFIPTNKGDHLLFNLNGNKFRWALPLSEVRDCAEDGTFRDQMPSGRAKIRQRFQELLTIHKGVIKLGER
jgi:hypothetical protein